MKYLLLFSTIILLLIYALLSIPKTDEYVSSDYIAQENENIRCIYRKDIDKYDCIIK